MEVLLAFGARPLPCPAPEGATLRAVDPPRPAAVADAGAAMDAALAHPAGARPLATVATARTRVVVVVRGDPFDAHAAAAFGAVRRALAAVPDDHLTVAVAAGPCGPARGRLPEPLVRRHRIVVHDPADEGATVEMGRTSRGTRIRVNRCVAEADLVVAAGRVAPDPFAGYGGGAAAIFPGLAHLEDAWRCRALAADAPALGAADGNPCREDLEEAVRRLGRDTYLADLVAVRGAVAGAVAGDVVYAHREGVRLARPWCEVEAAPADAVVVSAALPATASLCEATRLLAPAGLLLRDGGTVVLAAECPDGVGPLETVNARLYEGAARRWLPERHAVALVSALDHVAVERTYAAFAPTVAAALDRARAARGGGPLEVAVLPDAADLVPRPPRR